MRKYLRIWFWPMWTLIMLVLVAVYILEIYFLELSPEQVKTLEPLVSFFLTLIATLAGIFVPLQINRNWQKSDERKEMVFAMSYAWQELRKNLFVIEQIRINFTFKLILEQIVEFDELTNMINTKLSSMKKISQGLSNKYFLSALNSKMFMRIDKDEIFNEIFIAYDNIKTFEIKLSVLCEDLVMKKALMRDQYSRLTRDQENIFRRTYKEQILSVYSEIEYCKKSLSKTISLIDKRLEGLSVKAEFVERESYLLTELPDEITPDNEVVSV